MQTVSPMLCEKSEPFDDPNYSFEVKWDGERALFHLERGKLLIQNRKGKDMTYRYPEFQGLPITKDAVIDGEIIVLDETGRSNFERLAQRSHLEKKFDIELRSKKIPVTFMAFDILSLDGKSIMELPLTERRKILWSEFKRVPNLFEWSPPLDKVGTGTELFEMARARDLEGIVAKALESPYITRRSTYGQ